MSVTLTSWRPVLVGSERERALQAAVGLADRVRWPGSGGLGCSLAQGAAGLAVMFSTLAETGVLAKAVGTLLAEPRDAPGVDVAVALAMAAPLTLHPVDYEGLGSGVTQDGRYGWSDRPASVMYRQSGARTRWAFVRRFAKALGALGSFRHGCWSVSGGGAVARSAR